MAEDLMIFRLGFGDARDGLFRNDQNVGRRLGLHITESQHQVVLVFDRGWDFASDDLFEQGFAHGVETWCEKRKRSNESRMPPARLYARSADSRVRAFVSWRLRSIVLIGRLPQFFGSTSDV